MSTDQEPSIDSLTRGSLLKRVGAGAVGVSAASLLAACGSSSSSDSSASAGSAAGAITGQAILSNYPGWMGKNNLAAFPRSIPAPRSR